MAAVPESPASSSRRDGRRSGPLDEAAEGIAAAQSRPFPMYVFHRVFLTHEAYRRAVVAVMIEQRHVDFWSIHDGDLACCRSEPWVTTHGRILDVLHAAGVEVLAVEPTLERARG